MQLRKESLKNSGLPGYEPLTSAILTNKVRKHFPIRRPPPHASVRFCLKTEICFSGLVYCPQISSKKGHRKCIFSKSHSRVEIYESGGFRKRLRQGLGYQQACMRSSKMVPFSMTIAFLCRQQQQQQKTIQTVFGTSVKLNLTSSLATHLLSCWWRDDYTIRRVTYI